MANHHVHMYWISFVVSGSACVCLVVCSCRHARKVWGRASHTIPQCQGIEGRKGTATEELIPVLLQPLFSTGGFRTSLNSCHARSLSPSARKSPGRLMHSGREMRLACYAQPGTFRQAMAAEEFLYQRFRSYWEHFRWGALLPPPPQLGQAEVKERSNRKDS